MAGVITIWTGSLSSIPSPWSLCDGSGSKPNLLGKYLKSVGASEDPGGTGGSSTHTHTGNDHTHTQDGHVHSGTSANSDTTYWAADHTSGGLSRSPHHHTVSLDSTIATNESSDITLASTSSDPPYYEVAYIYDSADSKYPVSGIIYWNSATPPSGWTACNGSGGTPNLFSVFLRGVPNGSTNPGSTGGSSNNHTHTSYLHTHTQDGHTHTGSHGSASSVCNTGGSGSETRQTQTETHTHALTVASVTAVNQDASTSVVAADGQPVYYKLMPIQNQNAQVSRPRFGIVMWSGTISSIPTSYLLCDGSNGTPDLRNYFMKGVASAGEIGVTGGSLTHVHTISAHTHTQNSHVHTISFAAGVGTSSPYYPGDYTDPTNIGHTHSTNTEAVTTATNQTATVTTGSASNDPPYYKVAFLMRHVVIPTVSTLTPVFL